MRDRINRSRRLSRLIRVFSEVLAKQRGLFSVIGIAIAIVGLLTLLTNVFLNSRILEFSGLLIQGIGFVLAIIGLLLTEPLGK